MKEVLAGLAMIGGALASSGRDGIESLLNDPEYATRGFGVEFDASGTIEERAAEVAYGLGYEEGRTGRPMAMTKPLLAWGKKRRLPEVQQSYAHGVSDGRASAL